MPRSRRHRHAHVGGGRLGSRRHPQIAVTDGRGEPTYGAPITADMGGNLIVSLPVRAAPERALCEPGGTALPTRNVALPRMWPTTRTRRFSLPLATLGTAAMAWVGHIWHLRRWGRPASPRGVETSP